MLNKRLVFVVHKHKGHGLHYDLRLEVDGEMPSWALPKGPSLDPTVKRLAMMTEEHALEYRNFEGVIPEGEYGAGPVMIWDEGTYCPEHEENGERVQVADAREGEKLMRKGLERGKIEFFLEGKKLRGSFTLVRMTSGRFAERGNAWLLIKHHDTYDQPGYTPDDVSARSGRTLHEIARQ